MPDLHRATLDNGLRVLVAPLGHLSTATVAVFVKVGSRHESARDNGISHFLEHMLFRGTERHPSSYLLNLAIEGLGGSLDGETHADMTIYHATVPPEHVAEGVAVLGEMLRAPVFADLDVERRVVREEILEDLDEDGNDVNPDDAARRLVFAPHPLGFPIPGTLDNLARFDEDALTAHLRASYGARNVVVCASGRVDAERVIDLVAEAFGALPPGEPVVDQAPERTSASGRFLFVDHPDSQTDVRVSFPTFGEHDPRAPALHLLARILDDGLSARVPSRICDAKGLAYEAFAHLETWSDAGVLDFGASVAHRKAGEAVSELSAIAAELREGPVPEEEVERARRRWLFALRAIVDDDLAVASFYGAGALLGVDDTVEALAERVRAVSADEVSAVARDVLAPERRNVACVGDRTAERRVRSIVEAP